MLTWYHTFLQRSYLETCNRILERRVGRGDNNICICLPPGKKGMKNTTILEKFYKWLSKSQMKEWSLECSSAPLLRGNMMEQVSPQWEMTLCTGSSCYQDNFLVCLNTLGNKALSVSDLTWYSWQMTTWHGIVLQDCGRDEEKTSSAWVGVTCTHLLCIPECYPVDLATNCLVSSSPWQETFGWRSSVKLKKNV